MPAPASTTIPANPPFMKGSVIWQRKAGLPVWAWLMIGLAVAFAAMWWRRNKQSAAEATTATPDPNQQQTPVFIVPQAPVPSVINTVPGAPPGSGRTSPPSKAPGAGFPPTPREITVQAGTSSDDWINAMTKKYGVYWNQIQVIYRTPTGEWLPSNITGTGAAARFKDTKTYQKIV